MKTFEYTITDPVGIHARPAGILVKKVRGKTRSWLTCSAMKPRSDVFKQQTLRAFICG